MVSKDVIPIGEFRALGIEGHKRCFQCGDIKPIEEFCKDKRRPDGHTTLCKPCKALNTRERRNDPDKRAYYRRKRREWSRRSRQKTRTVESGFVYVFRFQSYYKIGITTRDVCDRAKDANTYLPIPVEIFHSISTNDVFRAEIWLHDRFRDKRKNGEWFELDDGDIEFITSFIEIIYE